GGVVRSTFSAHPHDVVSRRTTYNFGMRYGSKTTVALYVLPWEGPARCIAELPLSHPVMLHDFMATDDHLVLLVSPLRLVIHRGLLAIGDFSELFRWTPEAGTEVIVVPIDEPQRLRRFSVDAFFQIHLAGGFEEQDATVVDIMAYKDSSALQLNVAGIDQEPEAGVLTRIRIPHGAERIEKERLADTRIEFGKLDARVEGGPYRHVFGLTVDATRFGQVHVDLEKGEEHCFWFPEGEFAGEGIFVPKHAAAAEGEGHILCLVYEAASHTSHLAILDAEHIEDGPVARAHFDHHIPAGFHGVWVGEGVGHKSLQPG
ncbi:MAG: carotenoid oxygenase family protein, partial [Deltaproteobacteria bacterium]|nr:carotenoid oxygenase family protein [Deltaproteobacteria bacterium]